MSDESDDKHEFVTKFLDHLEVNGRIADATRETLALTAETLAIGLHALTTVKWPEHEGSTYTEDASTDVDTLGDVGFLVHREATLDLAAAADALRGWATLIRTQTSFIGAVACGRAVYESCVLVAAVTDPSLSVEQRSQRALTRRLSRLHASLRLNDSVGGGALDTTATQAEIDGIGAHAAAVGWKSKTDRFGVPYLGARFTVDGLTAAGLHGLDGVEGHAWGASSALIHGEHPETAQWILRFDLKRVPGYAPAIWSSGVPAGTRHVLATLSGYLNADSLHAEWTALAKAWDVVCSQPTGWRL